MTTNKDTCLAAQRFDRCGHVTFDGRRCRMLCSGGHPTLCPFHAREEQQSLESRRLGVELSASLTGRFMTGPDINFVLGKLFTALAQNRIPRDKAATLAHIAQLMLYSLPRVQTEFHLKYAPGAWQQMLANSTSLSDSASQSSSASSPGPGPHPHADPSSSDPAFSPSDDSSDEPDHP